MAVDSARNGRQGLDDEGENNMMDCSITHHVGSRAVVSISETCATVKEVCAFAKAFDFSLRSSAERRRANSDRRPQIVVRPRIIVCLFFVIVPYCLLLKSISLIVINLNDSLFRLKIPPQCLCLSKCVCVSVCVMCVRVIETLTLTASVFLEEGLGRLVHGDVQRDVSVTVDSGQRCASLQEKTDPAEKGET